MALDRLGADVCEVYQSERWESWLRSLSKFHDYSHGNTILIAMQMPTATHVASFIGPNGSYGEDRERMYTMFGMTEASYIFVSVVAASFCSDDSFE